MESLAGAAYDALKAAIEAGVPALAGRVAVDPQMNHLLRQPALAIIPAAAQWDRQQPIDRWTSVPGTIALDVGCMDTALQLRLSWASRAERQELEQAISSLFWGQEATPGTLVLPIHVEPFGDWYATFSPEDTLWEDDSATLPAEQRHQSTLALSGEIPAVGLRSGVPALATLQLGFGDELGEPWDETTVFRVNPDGSLSPPEGAGHGQ